ESVGAAPALSSFHECTRSRSIVRTVQRSRSSFHRRSASAAGSFALLGRLARSAGCPAPRGPATSTAASALAVGGPQETHFPGRGGRERTHRVHAQVLPDASRTGASFGPMSTPSSSQSWSTYQRLVDS